MLSEKLNNKSGRFARVHEPQISFLDLAFDFFHAFRDFMTGRTHLTTNADVTIAGLHVLDRQPREWADEIEITGQIIGLRDGITACFMRGDNFFTLNDLRHSFRDGQQYGAIMNYSLNAWPAASSSVLASLISRTSRTNLRFLPAKG